MAQCPPQQIVVGVDFSAASEQAVVEAGALAATFGTRLVAVHADYLDVPPYFTREQIGRLEEERAIARSQAEEALRAFVAARMTIDAMPRVVEGAAVDVLLQAAESADLLVVGTHGRRGPRRWWLGSVAERLVREAAIPVLVVHAGSADWAVHGTGRHVLVATSSVGGAEARRWASTIAAARGATVVEGPAPASCDAAHVTGARLIVVPLPADPAERNVHAAAMSLTRTCRAPLLFVPER